MGYRHIFICKVCTKTSSIYEGLDILVLHPRFLKQDLSKGRVRTIHKALKQPQSTFKDLGLSVFSCDSCNRWRSELDYQVLDSEGSVILAAMYYCRRCKTSLEKTASNKVSHCGSCGVKCSMGLDVNNMFWD